jgi:hypothetical protein
MYNTDPVWRFHMRYFQSASDGEELRERLITCIETLEASHKENIKHIKDESEGGNNG